MKIHEYQAKQIFARYRLPIPAGDVATTPGEAKAVAQKLGKRVVIKAQVHVGGRGKAGGIKLAETPEEAERVASQILGMNIKGLVVEKVLIEEALEIAAEYYLGATVDRSAKRNIVMVSAMGGVDIEEVARTHPQKISKLHPDPLLGLLDFQSRRLVLEAGLDVKALRDAAAMLKVLYRLYLENDCSLAEINPLVLTGDGKVIAADAKINVDDNALFRQKELAALRTEQEEDPLEAAAHQRGLAYVRLDGDIGIIGNGAGLVMTTLDVVQRAGGRPANFLDIGGGARAEVVREGLEIILQDQNVKGLLINIFGGITRCDEVAKGILQVIQEMDVKVPMVIRLTGTRSEEGRKLLVGTPLVPAETMLEAAEKIVGIARTHTFHGKLC